jgi:hypothetical protein
MYMGAVNHHTLRTVNTNINHYMGAYLRPNSVARRPFSRAYPRFPPLLGLELRYNGTRAFISGDARGQGKEEFLEEHDIRFAADLPTVTPL